MRLLHLLVFALYLPLVLGAGCAKDTLLGDDGPRNRRAKQGDVRCFSSFAKAKRAMHDRGTARREGWQWHHIVGQNRLNVSKFGAHDLHCTDNLVYLDKDMHVAITSHYNSGHRFTCGQRLYEWLAAKSFDEQYYYGLQVLANHGYRP